MALNRPAQAGLFFYVPSELNLNDAPARLDATKLRLDATKLRLDATKLRLDATKLRLDANKTLFRDHESNSPKKQAGFQNVRDYAAVKLPR